MVSSTEPKSTSDPTNTKPREETAGAAEALPHFESYSWPAGGWGALRATANALREQGVVGKGGKALLSMNQPDGFDCPGCAWPDPKHTSSFEFCENGAKAVAFELTSRRVTREFFAEHTVRELEQRSDYWLEEQGRLTEPMRYEAASDHYVPITWDDAFALIGRELRALESPDEAEFYTSGRTSNEAAFLYQLFVRAIRHQQLSRLLEHVPRADQCRAPGEHRHRQGHRAARRFRPHRCDLHHRARIPAPTVRA